MLKEFVHPIINETDVISIIKIKNTFADHAWNIAIMREKSEEMYLKAKKEICDKLSGSTEIELLFDKMVKCKQVEFAEYKSIIADFEIKKLPGADYDLTIVTTTINNNI